MRLPLYFYKYFYYEYWPMWLFYLPVLPYWLYLSIQNKSLAYFTVANPGIDLGGFFGESKSEILSLIDSQYLPLSINVATFETIEDLRSKLMHAKIAYPFIAKPDIGERGNDVYKINDENELENYHFHSLNNYIIQEFITYDYEFGMLYSRLPNSDKGEVSSITFKKFLTVVGDGKSTVRELMQTSVRARFQIERFINKQPELMDSVPDYNKSVLIEPIGNHCRGTEFVNFNHLISDNLNTVFDQISLPINGFYYGRFDLKVKSIEDLLEGKNIKIMELNGASSEPGHIYDSRFTIFKAYQDLLFHWKRLADISDIQIKNGFKPVGFKIIIRSYLKFAGW